jgi:molybdate transport system permease protein
MRRPLPVSDAVVRAQAAGARLRLRLPFSLWHLGCTVLAGIALLFLVLPLLVLPVRVVSERAWINAPEAGIVQALGLSLVSTLATLALTLLFGTPLAYALARWRFPLKRLANLLVELPIVLPPAVAGLALLAAFGRRGAFGAALEAAGLALPFTTAAVVLAQTFVSAPFYIRAAAVGFAGVPREIEDAARVDGAAGWALFRFVTLPLSGRALAAGLVLSWARALGEFGATILFAGSLQGRTQTMPLLIYNVLERDINAAIWTGVLLVGLALAALLAASALRRDGERE